MLFEFLLIALTLAGPLGNAAMASGSEVEIQVLHTNDIHSHYEADTFGLRLGGIARLKTLKDQLFQKDTGIFLDAGDFSEGGYGFTADNGFLSYKIMAAMGYDAVALGNHEWLNGIPAVLERWKATQRQFALLSANLVNKQDENAPAPLPPYEIIERSGVKIAILGFSTHELFYQIYLKPYGHIPPVNIAQQWVDYLREEQQADVVIVLSHLGRDIDRYIAARVKGIDLIVGGHSHELLQTPDWVENKETPTLVTPIVQAGSYAHYLGEVKLSYNRELKKVDFRSYRIHVVKPSIPENAEIRAWVDLANQQANQAVESRLLEKADQVRIKGDRSLLLPKDGPSNFTNLVADAYREFAHADIGLQLKQNTGSELVPNDFGWSKIDFFNALPFIFNHESQKSWTLHRYTMTVAQLKGYLRYALLFSHDLSISGAQIVYNPAASVFKLEEILDSQGVPFQDDQIITLATTSMMKDFRTGLRDLIRVDLPIIYDEDLGFEVWDVAFAYLNAKGKVALDRADYNFDRMIPTQADIFTPPHEVARVGNKIILPVYNLGLSNVEKGYRIQLWESPVSGEETDTADITAYETIYDQVFMGTVSGQKVKKHELELPVGKSQSAEKRKYYLLIRMIEQKEANHMNNFISFIL